MAPSLPAANALPHDCQSPTTTHCLPAPLPCRVHRGSGSEAQNPNTAPASHCLTLPRVAPDRRRDGTSSGASTRWSMVRH